MSRLQLDDDAERRKHRGAFFTPYPIAEYVSRWALAGAGRGAVLDPTCGEGVFLLACAERLKERGLGDNEVSKRLFGLDIDGQSVDETRRLLGSTGGTASIYNDDFFSELTPDQPGARLPYVDAVVGNPPYIRYQKHTGDARRRAIAAAGAQDVELSGLASSWAATLIHASAFLKPDGRVVFVLPAELLTVGYAEPIRQWLRRRFAKVQLVLFNELQFKNVQEQVVLLVARGSGGCDTFSLYQVDQAEELVDGHPFDVEGASPALTGKWSTLMLPLEHRGIISRLTEGPFTPLRTYGKIELGTVTGANNFFTIDDDTRVEYRLKPGRHLTPILPPGPGRLRGTSFTRDDWLDLLAEGARVWMLNPEVTQLRGGLADYVRKGEREGAHESYKCSIRDPWWRPPACSPPHLFFTYMSNFLPRIVKNSAQVVCLNSMHAMRLHAATDRLFADALPLLMLNSATMLGAELNGRSYGGGILKMEPSEARELPVPGLELTEKVWRRIASRSIELDRLLRRGHWKDVVMVIDQELLENGAGLSPRDTELLRTMASRYRNRRVRSSRKGKPGPQGAPQLSGLVSD